MNEFDYFYNSQKRHKKLRDRALARCLEHGDDQTKWPVSDVISMQYHERVRIIQSQSSRVLKSSELKEIYKECVDFSRRLNVDKTKLKR